MAHAAANAAAAARWRRRSPRVVLLRSGAPPPLGGGASRTIGAISISGVGVGGGLSAGWGVGLANGSLGGIERSSERQPAAHERTERPPLNADSLSGLSWPMRLESIWQGHGRAPPPS
eukprot:2463814-Prymnesium_polylepis.1